MLGWVLGENVGGLVFIELNEAICGLDLSVIVISVYRLVLVFQLIRDALANWQVTE